MRYTVSVLPLIACIGGSLMLSPILHAALRIHPRRIAVARLLAVLLLLLGATALPYQRSRWAAATRQQLRDSAVQAALDGADRRRAGCSCLWGRRGGPAGSHLRLDRHQRGPSELIEIVQIGAASYLRSGGQPWERSDDAPIGNAETQPVSAQFNLLQVNANAILDLGAANVGDVPTMHYQVWLSGDKALAITGELVEIVARRCARPDSERDVQSTTSGSAHRMASCTSS